MCFPCLPDEGMPSKKLPNHFFEGTEREDGLWLMDEVIAEDLKKSPQGRVGLKRRIKTQERPRPREKYKIKQNSLELFGKMQGVQVKYGCEA